ncbi:hypothetical protein OH77DRAFT_93000 [Trametes cingulata]|nr:hypothetical protein OH77DRAFT_93000 [Trametes cingulata]
MVRCTCCIRGVASSMYRDSTCMTDKLRNSEVRSLEKMSHRYVRPISVLSCAVRNPRKIYYPSR